VGVGVSPKGLPPKSAASPKMRCSLRGTCSPGRVAGTSDAPASSAAPCSAACRSDVSSINSVASDRTHAHSSATQPRAAEAGTAHCVARSDHSELEGISSRVRMHPSSRLPDASSNSSVTPSRTAGISPRAAFTQACRESWPDGSGSGNGWRSASEVQLSAVQLSERPELPLRCVATLVTAPQEGEVQA